MNRVLIIGGTGMVGPGVVRAFSMAGEAVTVMHRGQTPYPFQKHVDVVHLDREQPSFAEYLRSVHFDLIIDLACFSVEHAKTLVASVPFGQPVFVASTVLVHGGPVPRPLNEHSERSPLSDYARTKCDIEDIFRAASSSGRVCATILRLGTCYRQGSYLDGQLFEDTYWLHDLTAGRQTILADDGGATWTALHSDDCGEILLVLSRMEALGETILIANPAELTWNEYYASIAQAVNGTFRPCYIPGDWLVSQLGDCFLSEMSRWHQRYDLSKVVSFTGPLRMRPLQPGLAETAICCVSDGTVEEESNVLEDELLVAWNARI